MENNQKNLVNTRVLAFVDKLVFCYNCQNKFWTAVKTNETKQMRIRFCPECNSKQVTK